jgi:hypothetical protein
MTTPSTAFQSPCSVQRPNPGAAGFGQTLQGGNPLNCLDDSTYTEIPAMPVMPLLPTS